MKSWKIHLTIFVCLAIFFITGADSLAAQGSRKPALPLAFIDTQHIPEAVRTIAVVAGGDLQAALDAAQPGDEIVLEAGATFVGNFVLPQKPEDGWIIVRSSASDAELPTETRINLEVAPLLPKLVSPNAEAALRTEPGAHHFRFIGVEFTIGPEVTLNYGIVKLGDGEETDAARVPHHIVLDRCYIHGHDAADVVRGVALNSASTAIIDSQISECHGLGFDTQAICGWNGPGPFKIVNNYLEGAGENVLFGGADPKIIGLVPADIEFRRNHCSKPLAWKSDDPAYAGKGWSIKNIFEIKNARRVLVDGNIFEHNWVDAQNGFAILLTPRNQDGGAAWSVVEDVTFVNNVVRHAAAGINILGRDNNYPSQQTSRIVIKNNLFFDIGTERWGFNGRFLQITETKDVMVDHNTALQTGNILTAYGRANVRFVFTNNLVPHNEYGVVGDGTSSGLSTVTEYFPGLSFKKNVIVGGRRALGSMKKNYFPSSLDEVGFVDLANGDFRLAVSSPYKGAGTKDKDIGADIDLIETAIFGQAQRP